MIAAWTLTMISIPVLRWIMGDSMLPWGVTLGVCLQVAAVLAILHGAWGTGGVLRLMAIVLPLAWAIEWIGSTTGIPFSAYHYTGRLQPQLLGVPLLIPLAWLMMLPPAWSVANRICRGQTGAVFALLSALCFTAWDLFLDPQMVVWGYWVWEHPGGYFGIPWANFAGWLLSALLLTLAVRPSRIPDVPLLLVYAITWALQTIGLAIFWGMPGPALGGFLAMGACLAAALRAGPPPGQEVPAAAGSVRR